jgi:hypothetical protein
MELGKDAPASAANGSSTIRKIAWIGSIGGTLLGALLLFIYLSGQPSGTVRGRILSASSKMPVPDVMIVADSDIPSSERGFADYARTDEEGKFKLKAMAGDVSIRAWKPKYALDGAIVKDRSDREVIIELREMTATNWTEGHRDSWDIEKKQGFSFKLGRPVADSANADIIVSQDPAEPTEAYIEAQGSGGIAFQAETDFYNSPEAPVTGYERRVRVERRFGLYFVRTSDGSHYGKFRLFIFVVETPDLKRYLEMKEAEIQWASQNDGTRNLEIIPGKRFPFPVEKFGLSRDSLR